MKSNNQAIFHIIVTQLGWGLFLALNARRPLALLIFAEYKYLTNVTISFELYIILSIAVNFSTSMLPKYFLV